jgi:hypothetical protein
MIARLWHGRTHAERSDGYLGYLLETGSRNIATPKSGVWGLQDRATSPISC